MKNSMNPLEWLGPLFALLGMIVIVAAVPVAIVLVVLGMVTCTTA